MPRCPLAYNSRLLSAPTPCDLDVCTTLPIARVLPRLPSLCISVNASCLPSPTEPIAYLEPPNPHPPLARRCSTRACVEPCAEGAPLADGFQKASRG
eukprot:54969-Pleurochrysis_carterae.AAC.2